MSLTFPHHNLCEGFNTLSLKSILNPIFLERFIGDYKPWWLSWRVVSSGHRLLPYPCLNTVFIFNCLFFYTLDGIGIGRKLFFLKSTFTYTSVKMWMFDSFTASRCSLHGSQVRARWDYCCGFKMCHQANYVYYEGTRANFRINKQIYRHQLIKSAKNRQSHYPKACWRSIKITLAVYSLGQTVKYGLLKLES